MSQSVKGAEQASVTSNILKRASVCALCFSIVDWLRLKILSEPFAYFTSGHDTKNTRADGKAL